MIKLILFGFLVYVAYKIFRDWGVVKSEKKSQVKGKSKSDSLDLKDEDVQDARFEDIDEKKRP